MVFSRQKSSLRSWSASCSQACQWRPSTSGWAISSSSSGREEVELVGRRALALADARVARVTRSLEDLARRRDRELQPGAPRSAATSEFRDHSDQGALPPRSGRTDPVHRPRHSARHPQGCLLATTHGRRRRRDRGDAASAIAGERMVRVRRMGPGTSRRTGCADADRAVLARGLRPRAVRSTSQRSAHDLRRRTAGRKRRPHEPAPAMSGSDDDHAHRSATISSPRCHAARAVYWQATRPARRRHGHHAA